MTTRAAINILGSTGEIIDITTFGVDTLTTAHPSPGVYLVYGSLGMAPPPEGWGYVLNQADSGKTVDIQFVDGTLAVTIAIGGSRRTWRTASPCTCASRKRRQYQSLRLTLRLQLRNN